MARVNEPPDGNSASEGIPPLHHTETHPMGGEFPHARTQRSGAPSRAMRITVIGHHTLLADSIAVTLEREGHLVATVDFSHPQSSLATALAAALRSMGRLVLLEHDLGHIGNGMRLIAPLTTAGATVVLITESRNQVHWGEAIQQGAKDVLHKSRSLKDVVTIAQRVRDGLPLMSRDERATLVHTAVTDREEARTLRARLDRLTEPEMAVLGALMKGASALDIARTRLTTKETVRSQIKSILAKLEVTSQLAAVGAAHRVAWEPPLR